MSVRNQILSNLLTLRKGATFTARDVYHIFSNLDAKNASNRLSELAASGVIARVNPGTFKITSTVRERKALLS